jgi:ferredoxin
VIVGERKPLDEIIEQLEGAKKILLAGCGTCVSVCMAGGEKEVGLLATELRMALKLRGVEATTSEITVQRQCDEEFLEAMAGAVAGHDVILSTGCGAGIQFVARRFAPVRVVPALNTKFIGVTLGPGDWAEYCQACGDCVLHLTGGICPVSRCSKSLLNGPCGGSSKGHCEISTEVECAWQLIYDRLKAQGRLEQMGRVVKPKDWRSSRDGGPRRVRREEQKKP